MRRFRRIFRREAGFTLIELLVVIAVLGILTGIAVPRITGVRTKAGNAVAQTTANTIKNAFEMYYALEGKYPDLDGTEASLADLGDDLQGAGIQISLPAEDNFTISTEDNLDTTTYHVEISHKDGDTIYTITEKGIESSPK